MVIGTVSKEVEEIEILSETLHRIKKIQAGIPNLPNGNARDRLEHLVDAFLVGAPTVTELRNESNMLISQIASLNARCSDLQSKVSLLTEELESLEASRTPWNRNEKVGITGRKVLIFLILVVISVVLYLSTVS